MKVYTWICGCEKSPLNNLFPNGEYTTVKPPIEFNGICKICGQRATMMELEKK